MSGKARRGNGEGSVYQDKNRVWHAKLTVGRYRNGKPRYKEFKGKRKADVIARRDAYQKEYGDLSLESGANIPFADYITRWIENVKRNEQKEATYIRTVSTANTYIIPMIGGYKVAELTSDIIQLHLINEMRDMTCERTGEELSWSSIQKAYIYTKACLEYAVKNGVITRNPCANVTLPAKKQRQQRDIRFFDETEIARFRKACRKGMSKYEWVFEALLLTGMREGEICALKPSDIDFENHWILVHATLITSKSKGTDGRMHGRFAYQPQTKNGKNRYVPLGPEVEALFKKAAEHCPVNAYLVTQTKQPCNLSYLDRVYKTVCTRAGLANVHGPHDLRHTFASKLIREHVEIKVVSEVLGHSDTGFTYRTYVHLIDEQKSSPLAGIEWGTVPEAV